MNNPNFVILIRAQLTQFNVCCRKYNSVSSDERNEVAKRICLKNLQLRGILS